MTLLNNEELKIETLKLLKDKYLEYFNKCLKLQYENRRLELSLDDKRFDCEIIKSQMYEQAQTKFNLRPEKPVSYSAFNNLRKHCIRQTREIIRLKDVVDCLSLDTDDN